jgi:hypothetical protein
MFLYSQRKFSLTGKAREDPNLPDETDDKISSNLDTHNVRFNNVVQSSPSAKNSHENISGKMKNSLLIYHRKNSYYTRIIMYLFSESVHKLKPIQFLSKFHPKKKAINDCGLPNVHYAEIDELKEIIYEQNQNATNSRDKNLLDISQDLIDIDVNNNKFSTEII